MSQYVRQHIYIFVLPPTWLAGLSLCIYSIKQQKNVNVTFKTWHDVLGLGCRIYFYCIWANSYADCIREGIEPATFFFLSYETTVQTTAPPPPAASYAFVNVWPTKIQVKYLLPFANLFFEPVDFHFFAHCFHRHGDDVLLWLWYEVQTFQSVVCELKFLSSCWRWDPELLFVFNSLLLLHLKWSRTLSAQTFTIVGPCRLMIHVATLLRALKYVQKPLVSVSAATLKVLEMCSNMVKITEGCVCDGRWCFKDLWQLCFILSHSSLSDLWHRLVRAINKGGGHSELMHTCLYTNSSGSNKVKVTSAPHCRDWLSGSRQPPGLPHFVSCSCVVLYLSAGYFLVRLAPH